MGVALHLVGIRLPGRGGGAGTDGGDFRTWRPRCYQEVRPFLLRLGACWSCLGLQSSSGVGSCYGSGGCVFKGRADQSLLKAEQFSSLETSHNASHSVFLGFFGGVWLGFFPPTSGLVGHFQQGVV